MSRAPDSAAGRKLRRRMAAGFAHTKAVVQSYGLEANSHIQESVSIEQIRQTVNTVGLYWRVTDRLATVNGANKSDRHAAP